MPRSPRLVPGNWVPEFSAEDEQGRLVSLGDFAERWVLLYFYVADGRPGCEAQALGYRRLFEEIRAQGAVVLAMSADPTASHAAAKARLALPFTLLTDERHAIAQAYGAWGTRMILGETITGVLRSHFVIMPGCRLMEARVGVSASDSAAIALETLQGRAFS